MSTTKNQYGYVPTNKTGNLKEVYSIANPSTWTFERNGQLFGGVEEVVFSDNQKLELIACGGSWFSNSAEFLNWFYEE
ncbi:MAG: hypothetical protein HC836_41265 [Richelia sp. RM2_1_2]|nr:hypothetical protein [Richelia sp. RM2_1_2]